MEEADHKGPAAGPAGGGFKVAEDIGTGVAAGFGHDENGNGDGDDTGKCPKDGSSLG